MAKVTAWEYDDYTLLGTRECHVFKFRAPPILDLRPLTLGDGSPMLPGDRVTYFGGRYTSAGYSRLHLKEGFLEYRGIHRGGPDPDGYAVLFHWSERDDPLLYYGGYLIEDAPLKLVYTTPAVSGRIIETTTVHRVSDLVAA